MKANCPGADFKVKPCPECHIPQCICHPCPEVKKGFQSPRFDQYTNHFASGLVSISRKHLFDAYDFGVPMSSNAEGENSLILYQSNNALPNDKNVSLPAQYNGDIPHMTDALEATENCDQLNVLFTKPPGKLRQCTALIGGQYQGYHIQRWMRVKGRQLMGRKYWGRMDPSNPLHHVGR